MANLNDSTKDLSIPSSYGRFKILKLLGKGGMGKVYKVYDPKLKCHMALKVLMAQDNASEKAIERFLVEVQVTAKLNHPNIVRLYEVGEHQNTHFFTMDYIEGISFGQYLKSKKVSLRKSIEILIKAASAIEHAHTQGIIHRDLKPDNIMLNQNKEPFIMDFGLAKELDKKNNLSKTGDVMGTPFYMSPEQVQGQRRHIDHRTDVYALGVILYEMATGKRPFHANSSVELFMKIIEQTPKIPSKVNSRTPKDIDAICLKTMAKKKEERYTSAKEFAEDLERYLQGKKIQAQKPSTMNKMVAPVVVLILFLIALFIFLQMRRSLNPKDISIEIKGSKKLVMGNKSTYRLLLSNQGEQTWENIRLEIELSKGLGYSNEESIKIWKFTLAANSKKIFKYTIQTLQKGKQSQQATLFADKPIKKFSFTVEVKEGIKGPFDSKVWQACWKENSWFDFTTSQWRDLSHSQHVKYAARYQKWYANRIKQPVEKTFVYGKCKLPMLLIPPGRYWYKAKKKKYRLGFRKAFWMGKTEVTQLQWKQITGRKPRLGPLAKKNPQHAMNYVSWKDVQRDIMPKLGKKFSLPTQGKWEYTCRSGTLTRYYWGDNGFKISKYAWNHTNTKQIKKSYPHAVAKKRPNAWGLYDMIGNVWSMCHGRLRLDKDAFDPPVAPVKKSVIVVGGAWNVYIQHCHSSSSSNHGTNVGKYHTGFRLMRVLE